MKQYNHYLKIDLVYLWVDGNDPKWLAKKNKALAASGKKIVSDRTDTNKFFDNDELQYSLRSAEKFAPWINHIFIVTDGQTPKWLDTKNPKITIVDHKEILPKKSLPIFNSNAIESAIPNIKGLAEHFIYGNDDMFFGAPVDPLYFFNNASQPIIRGQKRSIDDVYNDSYNLAIVNAKNIVKKICGNNHDYKWVPAHNIDPYLKSVMKTALKNPIAQKALKIMLSNSFGQGDDLQRVFFHDYMLEKGLAVKRIYSKMKKIWMKLIGTYSDFPQYVGHAQKLEKMMKKNKMPKLFCINNSGKNPERDEYNHKFLENFLPNKSKVEK